MPEPSLHDWIEEYARYQLARVAAGQVQPMTSQWYLFNVRRWQRGRNSDDIPTLAEAAAVSTPAVVVFLRWAGILVGRPDEPLLVPG